MPRRGFVAKRDILPDPLYQSPLVTKFINSLMSDGKKSKHSLCSRYLVSRMCNRWIGTRRIV